MGKEYEAKFLDIDYKKMCKKLKEIKPMKNKGLLKQVFKTYKFKKNSDMVEKFLEL